MKVIAFVGSPRRDGNTKKLVKAICEGAKESGHEVDMYHLSEMNNKGCIACDACQRQKVDFCSIDDKLTTLLPEIAKADCLIVGTPIYMLHVSGETKNFLDRMRAFLNPDLTTNHLPGKKYITVTCSGAPAAQFSNVTDYLNDLLGLYKMENSGNIIAANLREKDDIIWQAKMLEEAEAVGRKLS